MIVECQTCNTIFPVDPKKVPAGGVHARCSVCNEIFFVDAPEPEVDVLPPMESGMPEEIPVTEGEEGGLAEGEGDELAEEVGGEFAEEEEASDGGVKAEVDESEGAFDQTEPTFGEPETTWEEAEPALEETDVTVEEAESTFQEAETTVEEAESTFQEAETTVEQVYENVPETAEEIPDFPEPDAPLFGKRDPSDKAQRLARVLVSDIILYNPDRHHMATESGRVREEFEEEIQKSWNEYVEQVGEDVANSTNFFNDALNEILAKGEKIF